MHVLNYIFMTSVLSAGFNYHSNLLLSNLRGRESTPYMQPFNWTILLAQYSFSNCEGRSVVRIPTHIYFPFLHSSSE